MLPTIDDLVDGIPSQSIDFLIKMMFNHFFFIVGLASQHPSSIVVPPPSNQTITGGCNNGLIFLICQVNNVQESGFCFQDQIFLLDEQFPIFLFLDTGNIDNQLFHIDWEVLEVKLSSVWVHKLDHIGTFFEHCYSVDIFDVDAFGNWCLYFFLTFDIGSRVGFHFFWLGFQILQNCCFFNDIVGELLPIEQPVSVDIDLFEEDCQTPD